MTEVQLSGPRSGYNDAAIGGGVIALAGQTAAEDVIAASGGFVSEFDSALSRLVIALEEAGGRVSELLHVRIFVIDMDAYVDARPQLGECYRRCLGDHFPATTLVEVSALLGGAQVELDGLATRRSVPALQTMDSLGGAGDAVIRVRLAPSDARFAGEIASGSKSMEIFADLETELALREGGDEGLCVAYDMVEFLVPLHVGDFVEGRARVVDRGRSSRRVAAEIYKVLEVDNNGILQATDKPVLATRASATIVVGRVGGDARR